VSVLVGCILILFLILQRILIGKNGIVIKTVANETIADLEKTFGRTVRLFLYVMSRKPNWSVYNDNVEHGVERGLSK